MVQPTGGEGEGGGSPQHAENFLRPPNFFGKNHLKFTISVLSPSLTNSKTYKSSTAPAAKFLPPPLFNPTMQSNARLLLSCSRIVHQAFAPRNLLHRLIGRSHSTNIGEGLKCLMESWCKHLVRLINY
jgi:hypothetical protein